MTESAIQEQKIEVICELQMPEMDHVMDHIKANATGLTAKDMVQAQAGLGKRVIICGAGPSLANLHQDLRQSHAHQVWACNSALPYLKDHGLPVTHGFAIDQGREMMNSEEWERTFDVNYLVASSLHPDVIAHLRSKNRRLRWFHNYIGLKDPEGWVAPPEWKKPNEACGYEMYMYQTHFPPAVQVGYGLNSVPRAICLALWMGFKSIRVYGADCAASPDGPRMPESDSPAYISLLQATKLYADGQTAHHYGDRAVMVEAHIESQLGNPQTVHRWHTRADMVISAVHLVDLVKTYPGRITLVGDTLPNAMMDKPKDWFEKVPRLTGKGSISGFGVVERPLTPVEA